MHLPVMDSFHGRPVFPNSGDPLFLNLGATGTGSALPPTPPTYDPGNPLFHVAPGLLALVIPFLSPPSLFWCSTVCTSTLWHLRIMWYSIPVPRAVTILRVCSNLFPRLLRLLVIKWHHSTTPIEADCAPLPLSFPLVPFILFCFLFYFSNRPEA
jgi:hypothetical protein